MHDQDDLDRVLDSALSSYAAPAPGFEERILGSVTAAGRAHPEPRRSWLQWAIAIPAAACLLIALALFLHPRPRKMSGVQHARNAPAVSQAPRQETAASSGTPALPHPRPRRALPRMPGIMPAVAAGLPKRDLFPTPQPLTPAEQAFIRYVATAPEQDRRSLLEAQAKQDAPLAISAIKIAPITIPDQSGNQGEP